MSKNEPKNREEAFYHQINDDVQLLFSLSGLIPEKRHVGDNDEYIKRLSLIKDRINSYMQLVSPNNELTVTIRSPRKDNNEENIMISENEKRHLVDMQMIKYNPGYGWEYTDQKMLEDYLKTQRIILNL